MVVQCILIICIAHLSKISVKLTMEMFLLNALYFLLNKDTLETSLKVQIMKQNIANNTCKLLIWLFTNCSASIYLESYDNCFLHT